MSDKKKKSMSGFTIGCAALVALLFVLGYDGSGLGLGSGFSLGSGSGSSSPTQSQSQNTPASPNSEAPVEETKRVILEITVSGSDYLFQNSRMDINTLMTHIREYSTTTEIHITADETATINAMDDLTERLAANGYIHYSKR